MRWKRKMRDAIEREVLAKMFAWVGTYYSEGPRPAVQGDESPNAGAFQTVVPKVRNGKVISRIVSVYNKNLLKRVYTEIDVVKNLLAQLERAGRAVKKM